LRTDEQVRLSIYDARGALVSTLESGMLPAGSHQAFWNGRDQANRPVAAGIYFVRFQAGAYSATEKMMFLK
jgi:flagellar hook assembly protein FlgD